MAPAINTNNAQTNRLVLNAVRRPMMSALNPQNAAPTKSPTWEANATPAMCLLGLPNS